MAVPLESLFFTTHLDIDQNPLLLALKLAIWTPIGISLVIGRLVGSTCLLSVLLVVALVAPGFVLPLWIRRLLLFFIGINIKYDPCYLILEIRSNTDRSSFTGLKVLRT
jgi:hypothetical protein